MKDAGMFGRPPAEMTICPDRKLLSSPVCTSLIERLKDSTGRDPDDSCEAEISVTSCP